MERLMKKEIVEERKAVEEDVIALLEEVKSGFTLEDVKDAVYRETEQDDMTKIIAMFDTGEGDVHIGTVLELVTDAWNHFPHRLLGGKSPREMVAGR